MPTLKRRLLIAAMFLPLCAIGVMLVPLGSPQGFSLFGADRDLSLGLVEGLVVGAYLGLAIVLLRKRRRSASH